MTDAEELEKINRAIALEDYRAYVEEGSQRLGFQVDYSQAGLRNLQLVNGGAVIALLTIVGNTSVDFDYRSLWWAFFWFGSGLALSLLAYFGAFFSQHFFMQQTFTQAWDAQARARGIVCSTDQMKSFRHGNIAFGLAIIFAIVSLTCFVTGSFVALEGL
ncbi:hypothetical protein [Qipengyuania flava]|uniref:hypothetical protein n=1 Tax=Qipengyuania flava TaxID=192812 RepID=UPI00321AD191